MRAHMYFATSVQHNSPPSMVVTKNGEQYLSASHTCLLTNWLFGDLRGMRGSCEKKQEKRMVYHRISEHRPRSALFVPLHIDEGSSKLEPQ